MDALFIGLGLGLWALLWALTRACVALEVQP